MRRQDAETILRHVDVIIEAIDACGAAIQAIEDELERKSIARGLASAAGEITTEVFMPITKQYPDLDPFAKRSGRGRGDRGTE